AARPHGLTCVCPERPDVVVRSPLVAGPAGRGSVCRRCGRRGRRGRRGGCGRGSRGGSRGRTGRRGGGRGGRGTAVRVGGLLGDVEGRRGRDAVTVERQRDRVGQREVLAVQVRERGALPGGQEVGQVVADCRDRRTGVGLDGRVQLQLRRLEVDH